MYKVLIADDEKIIRMGLCSIIDWNAEGFEIMGQAANGSEALQMIEQYDPDVVLIDIRMPKLHGLDAIREARAAGFTGRVIVLSGYSDFEYAQTAINYGVLSYLTKPVDTEQLLSVIRKIRMELDEEARLMVSRDGFFIKTRKSVLRGFFTEELTLNEVEISELGLTHSSYQVLFYEKYDQNTKDITYSLSDILRVTNTDEQEIETIQIDDRQVLLLKGHHPIERLSQLLEKYDNELPPEKNSPLDSIFIACGSVVKHVSEIPRSYHEALHLMSRRFFCDENQHTMLYNGSAEAASEEAPELNSNEKHELKQSIITEYAERFINNIQVFNRNKIAETLQQLRDVLYNAPLTIEDEKNLAVDIYLKIKEKLLLLYSQSEIPFPANSAALQYIMNSCYLHEILLFFSEQFDMVMTSIGYSSRDSIIDDVIYYIDHNYQTNITLENIAPLFGYNSSYLGKIFSKKMGMNFNAYLDHVRTEKAKEILQTSKAQVYKVAEMVGYKNVDYFHIKFKKHTGCSPAEYRKQNS